MMSAKIPKLQQAQRIGRWGRQTTETEGSCTPWRGIHAGTRFLSEPVTCGGTKQEWCDPEILSDPEGLNHMEKDPYWSNSWKPADSGKGTHWRSLGKAVTLGRDLIVEQGHGRGISVLNWLQSPLPIPSVLPGERRQKTQEWRAQEYVAKWAEVFFYFCSYFSLSYSGVNWQKLKWIFSRMSLVYTSTVTALYLTHELSHFIFSPCSAREG